MCMCACVRAVVLAFVWFCVRVGASAWCACMCIRMYICIRDTQTLTVCFVCMCARTCMCLRASVCIAHTNARISVCARARTFVICTDIGASACISYGMRRRTTTLPNASTSLAAPICRSSIQAGRTGMRG